MIHLKGLRWRKMHPDAYWARAWVYSRKGMMTVCCYRQGVKYYIYPPEGGPIKTDSPLMVEALLAEHQKYTPRGKRK